MTKIDRFDKVNCEALANDVLAAIKAAGVEEKYGVNLSRGRGRFGASTFTLKIEAVTLRADGTVPNKEAEAFKKHAAGYGLAPTDLGRKFRSHGRGFTVTGLKPANRKFPFIAKREDNRSFKFTAAALRGHLAAYSMAAHGAGAGGRQED